MVFGCTKASPANITTAAAQTSYLVEVLFPAPGKRSAFRWPTSRQASRCAKDFAALPGQTAATAPQVTITPQQGRMTFEGWRTVQGGAA